MQVEIENDLTYESLLRGFDRGGGASSDSIEGGGEEGRGFFRSLMIAKVYR